MGAQYRAASEGGGQSCSRTPCGLRRQVLYTRCGREGDKVYHGLSRGWSSSSTKTRGDPEPPEHRKSRPRFRALLGPIEVRPRVDRQRHETKTTMRAGRRPPRAYKARGRARRRGSGAGAAGGTSAAGPGKAAPRLVGVVVRLRRGAAAHAPCTEACFTSVTTGELGFLFSPFVPPGGACRGPGWSARDGARVRPPAWRRVGRSSQRA